MNAFNKAMEVVGTETRTLNNAKTYSSTLSKCLDLFALGGSARHWSDNHIDVLFEEAYKEDPVLAVKIALYIRDVRGGQGERATGRKLLTIISNKELDPYIKKVIPYVSEIGRWDDLVYVFHNTKNKEIKAEIANFIKNKLVEDLGAKNPSLLGKWLPSINAGKTARAQALDLTQHIGISLSNYRKMLSKLRKKIDIIETKVTSNQFSSIDYEKIPSQAMLRYSSIFKRKDWKRFSEFTEAVKKGTSKVNTQTLYPHQIVNNMFDGLYKTNSKYNAFLPITKEEIEEAKAQVEFLDTLWDNLPDFVNDSKAMVVADTSGSMFGSDAIGVSLGLAIYFAERNNGPFKDKFITFSGDPEFQILKGNTLSQKMSSFDMNKWAMNTNLEKTFDLILDTAIEHSVPQEDMPETLYIISDMEFDESAYIIKHTYGDKGDFKEKEATTYEAIRERYKDAGYEMPVLVFWNAYAYKKTLPARENEQGVVLISGQSPAVFSMVMERSTPLEFMIKLLEPRYSFVE